MEQKLLNDNTNTKIPVYTKSWFVILMLIVFFPVGLWLMWAYKKNWNIIVKILITAFFAYCFIESISSESNTNNSSDEGMSSQSSYAENIDTENNKQEIAQNEQEKEEQAEKEEQERKEQEEKERKEQEEKERKEKEEQEAANFYDKAVEKLGDIFSSGDPYLDGEYKTILYFDYEDNLILAKDNMDIYVDGQKCYTVLHGSVNANVYNLDEGKHNVKVTSGMFHSDDEDIYVKKSGQIFYFHIKNHTTEVELSLTGQDEIQ